LTTAFALKDENSTTKCSGRAADFGVHGGYAAVNRGADCTAIRQFYDWMRDFQ